MTHYQLSYDNTTNVLFKRTITDHEPNPEWIPIILDTLEDKQNFLTQYLTIVK